MCAFIIVKTWPLANNENIKKKRNLVNSIANIFEGKSLWKIAIFDTVIRFTLIKHQ